ncbi:MAG: hypothetical protein WA083_04620, partial [Candidatus Moraniibacteriota bacterium]
MKTKLSTYIFFLVLAIFFGLANFVEAATCTWSGTTSTAWAIGTNWSCGAEPGSGDDVTINIASANQPIVDFSGGSKTINSLSIGASAVSTLTFSNASAANYLIVSGDVAIGGSGTITHTANTTIQTHIVKIQAANFSIAANGKINANYRGLAPRNGTGKGALGDYSSGGGYGGSGGYGSTYLTGGISYGSLTQPIDIGSSGGQRNDTSAYAGKGGGMIKLDIAGTTTINGEISVDGQNYQATTGQPGGGSGGSIWLTTGTLAGTGGTISSIGGNGYGAGGGGGGGGRIAVYYTTDSSLNIAYLTYGGTGFAYGGAGTVYKKEGSNNGDLVIDNNNQDNATDDRYIGKTPIGDTIDFRNIIIRNYGNLDIQPTANINHSSIDWSTKGVITDNGGSFDLLNSGVNLEIPATARLMGNAPRTFTGLTVNGILTHSSNTIYALGERYKINYTINGDFLVNVGGLVDTNYRGYQISEGFGAGVDGSYVGGGSYGGAGGKGIETSAGPVYGNIKEPNNLGSGGGIHSSTAIGAGGGAVRLIVSGVTTLLGNVTSMGQDSGTGYPGGGSGGSIWIDTATLIADNVVISANGGVGHSSYSGGGGGGRIAIYYYDDNTNFLTPTSYQTYGGIGFNFAGAGTIYKKDKDDPLKPNGDLIIDNNNKNPLDKYDIGKTYLISNDTFDDITIQNYGYLSTTPTTEAYYSSIDWSTKGVIEDDGGTFALLSDGSSLTVPATSIFYDNYSRNPVGYIIDGFMETTVPINTAGDFNINSTGTLTHKYNTTSQLYTVD